MNPAASSWTSFCNLVWPAKCALCGALGDSFCAACRSECVGYDGPLALPGLDSVTAVYRYEGRAKEAVARLKFSRSLALAEPMAAMVAELPLPAFDVAVPVPIHWSRRARRGFNQAAELARALPNVRSESFLRIRRTGTQRTRDRAARLAAVRGAFRAHDVAGARVLIVDDVCTSGGTLRACAEALREAGASEVHAAVFARLA